MPRKPDVHRPHARPAEERAPAPDQHEKNVAYGRRWKRLRAVKLAAQPLCEDCLARGEVVAALDVDHVVPLSRGGERLDMANLRALCRRCHNRKTHGRRNKANRVG